MRKGLFLSRHHGKIADIVDMERLSNAFPDIETIKVYNQFYEPSELRDLLYRVKENRLDAVVMAGPSASRVESSRLYQSLIDALKVQGVNPNRVALANIYEHAALMHAGQPETATEKAGLLIEVALAKVDYCPEVTSVYVRPKKSVMIIGATDMGLSAAVAFLGKGYDVTVIDRQADWRLDHDQEAAKADLRMRITSAPNAKVLFNSDVKDMSGWSGDFKVTVKTLEGGRELSVGGILVCVGDDKSWISDLQPMLRLDTDEAGCLLNCTGNRMGGETKEAGIWFLPSVDLYEKSALQKAAFKKAVDSISAMLEKIQLEHPMLVSEVDEARCGGCGICVKTCAFSASGIYDRKKIAVIDAKRCKGCGNCVAACPTGARDLVTLPSLYVHRAIEILSRGVTGNGDPKVLAFLCKNSGDLAGGKPEQQHWEEVYPSNIMPLTIECGGSIDTVHLLKAFKEGFDGVALVVCKDRHCRNLAGNTDMERRVGLLRAILRSRHMDDNRMRIIHTYGCEGKRLREELAEFCRELKGENVNGG